MSTTTSETGARVVPIPPPLYYAAAMVGGVLLDRVFPLAAAHPALRVAGIVIACAGAGSVATGVLAVIRHRTTIVPHRPVAALITTGVYRISRNPMYLGLALVIPGVGLLLGTWWPLVLLPLTLLAVTRLVIVPEERYLHQRFPAEYDAYRARVRRWL
ncbi:methyltransferase family protein [Nocardia asteroides]|uniref:methyltransferase family protein n=1 Tax=Nocardia asteroides TaxID=1824 RepID=UPI001E6470FE|nr:isoprenylcysteine carboxylmethyltransferase family protein [Nocardia asteroides]UGT61873.1 isoprenylcysteine carboxylmethyltransferase family protein [Nocardia asteroides]